jgi:SNF2 family DNA or RNA helicase
MTPREFTPHPYQSVIIDHILANRRGGIWAGMGLGKTSATLTALDRLDLIEDVFPALIVAPLRVAQSTWPDEIEKWAHLVHLSISPVIGDLGQRIRALQRRAHIYTINYEQIPWLVDLYGKKWPFKTIVSDESTRLKGFRLRQGTKRARSLAQVAHIYCNRFIELTGTPAPNGLQDLWGPSWFLDEGARLGRSYSSFEQRWFRRGWDGYSLEPIATAQGEIQEKLSDICIAIKAEDYFDLEKPVESTVYIDLPVKARKLYKDMEDEMYMELEGLGVEAFNAAGKTNKCHQLANGTVYTDEKAKEWWVVHDEKIEALRSIIEEAGGMPVLVAYHFRSDLRRLCDAFPAARTLDKNPKTLKDWNKGKIPIMFAHPASAGHGLNLQDGSNILVYFTVDWNLELHEQIFERIGPVRQLQAGHNRSMFVYYIIARDTVEDQMIMPRLKTKKSVQDILTEAMKARRQ